MKGFSNIFIVTFLLVSTSIYAQDANAVVHSLSISVPEVALVDLETNGGSSVDFNFIAPQEAGESLNPPAPNSSFWLNYTSTVRSSTSKRRITAQLSSTISGIDVLLTANSSTSGEGDLGSSSGQITLNSTVAQTIINNIGTCFTGDGPGYGSQLTYALSINDIAATYIMNSSLSVTFTITEDS